MNRIFLNGLLLYDKVNRQAQKVGQLYHSSYGKEGH